MNLKLDERGRPIGLEWPEAPKEPITRNVSPDYQLNRKGIGGRYREDSCQAGLHDMNVTGVEIPAGGRYCKECRNEYRRKNRDRINKQQRLSRARKSSTTL